MKVNSMNHMNKIIRTRKLLDVLFEVACDEKTHPEVGYCNHVCSRQLLDLFHLTFSIK